jgi:hypothetical protein
MMTLIDEPAADEFSATDAESTFEVEPAPTARTRT